MNNIKTSKLRDKIKQLEKEIWVAGFPSHYGGAGTELDHQIDLWIKNGITVYLVPMPDYHKSIFNSVLERGCRIIEYKDDVFKDKIVASWCNGEFLKKLPIIHEKGKPKKVIWFNCMTWLFDDEKIAHKNGMIDIFGFVSDYQKNILVPQLEKINPHVGSFDYQPYFNYDRIRWSPKPIKNDYCIGRISREDPLKFSKDTWNIFEKVSTPTDINKKVYILGYNDEVESKIGKPPQSLDVTVWEGNDISAEQFYSTIHAMIHKTGGSRESYCRVLIECYAHGSVPIVENNFAFPGLVVNGRTGFLCNSSEEMSYYASVLCSYPEKYYEMLEAGRDFLREMINEKECMKAWNELL